MKRSLILAAAAAAALFGAGAAHASNVHWSIGINLPPVGTVISNVPYYAPAPVYYPAPVQYVPQYQEAQVIYEEPAIVYGAPRPLYGHRPYYERPVVVFRGGRDARWSPPAHRDVRWVSPVHDRDGHRRHHD